MSLDKAIRASVKLWKDLEDDIPLLALTKGHKLKEDCPRYRVISSREILDKSDTLI
jgi:hypothetical protein